MRELIANARLTLDERQQIFTALVESPLLDYFRAGQIDQVDALATSGWRSVYVRDLGSDVLIMMETPLLQVTLCFYLLSTAAFFLLLVSTRPFWRRLAPALLSAAFLAHAGAIAARSITAGYLAVIDSYEALSFFACLMSGVCLLAQLRAPVAILGAVVSPLSFIVTMGAFVFFTKARALPPSLHSAWLPIHITFAFLGNAVFGVAFTS